MPKQNNTYYFVFRVFKRKTTTILYVLKEEKWQSYLDKVIQVSIFIGRYTILPPVRKNK